MKRSESHPSAWRSASVPGDQSLYLDATVPATDRIQALQADGFQVGGHAQINASGATFHYLAFRDDPGPPQPTATASFTATETFTATRNTDTDGDVTNAGGNGNTNEHADAHADAYQYPDGSISPRSRRVASMATGRTTGRSRASASQPDVILLRSGGTAVPVIRTSTMAGDATKIAGDLGALQPNLVQSLESDGFTVGTDARVNASGTTYYWVAMKAGSDLTVGSYTGNGTNNRPITGVGFQPDWLVTLGDGGNSVFRPGTLAGNASYRLTGFSTVGNRIQALQPDGFQIGSDVDVNQNGTTFHYIAWRGGAAHRARNLHRQRRRQPFHHRARLPADLRLGEAE